MGPPVYLVRHGQSVWNVRRLVQGQTPHPRLTALGRTQARTAASLIRRDLGGGDISRIRSSDLCRARDTAEILGAATGAPVTVDHRLRERHFGVLQGQSYEDAALLLNAHGASWNWCPPGGETLAAVLDRMVGALHDAVSGGPTVLVSHGDAIGALVGHLVRRSYADAAVEVTNGAVARVDDTVTWLG